MSKYPIIRIYNGIDTNIFQSTLSELRQQHDWERKFIILGVSSGWAKTKLETFIQIANSMAEDTVIVLVGRINKHVTVPENIVMVGETHDTRELAQYYSMADAFVNPSKEETFGKVTAEALACGTPSIVFNSTANPELIGENCGYVVEDMPGVVNAILQVKQSGKALYSNHCVSQVRELFDNNDRLQEYLQLYKTIFSRKLDKQ